MHDQLHFVRDPNLLLENISWLSVDVAKINTALDQGTRTEESPIRKLISYSYGGQRVAPENDPPVEITLAYQTAFRVTSTGDSHSHSGLCPAVDEPVTLSLSLRPYVAID